LTASEGGVAATARRGGRRSVPRCRALPACVRFRPATAADRVLGHLGVSLDAVINDKVRSPRCDRAACHLHPSMPRSAASPVMANSAPAGLPRRGAAAVPPPSQALESTDGHRSAVCLHGQRLPATTADLLLWLVGTDALNGLQDAFPSHSVGLRWGSLPRPLSGRRSVVQSGGGVSPKSHTPAFYRGGGAARVCLRLPVRALPTIGTSSHRRSAPRCSPEHGRMGASVPTGGGARHGQRPFALGDYEWLLAFEADEAPADR